MLLSNYSSRSLENARRGLDELFGIQNSRKARLGALAGLQDPAVMNAKRAEEKQLRASVAQDAKLKSQYGTAWDDIAQTITAAKKIRTDYNLLEGGAAFNTQLFHIARTLVRMADEDQKPNAKRLHEFSEAGRDSLEQELYSESPIYSDLEIVTLADSLGMLMEQLGAEHELVSLVLDGKSPRERATELILGSKLAQVSERKRLAAGPAAIKASDDTLIRLAQSVDARAREVRKMFEQEVEEPRLLVVGVGCKRCIGNKFETNVYVFRFVLLSFPRTKRF